ncbi:MAG: TolC family outer membrane protein [Neptuniibacter sp.]
MNRFVAFMLLISSLFSACVSADTLYDLYQQTLESEPRLQISSEEIEVGYAQYKQAESALLPQVSFRASWTDNQRKLLQNDTNEHYKGERYNLTVQQTVLDLNKWYNRSRYEKLSDATELSYEAKKIEVVGDLVSRYLDVLASQDTLALVQAEINATEKQLELLKSRYEHQLAVLTDLLEVEARLGGIKAEEISVQARLDIALEALSELVGRPVYGPIPDIMQDIPIATELKSLDLWIKDALVNNPLLLSLNENVRAEEARLKQSKSERLPTVDLSLSAQKSDIGFENSASNRTETYVASLNLNVPLFMGGRVSAQKSESRAYLNIARLQYDEARRSVLKDLRASYLNTNASWTRISAAKNALTSAGKSLEAQEKGFSYGTVTVVDVLDALREKFRFQRDFRQAQYDFIMNWVQLMSHSGTLSDKHIELIDSWAESS